MVSAYFYAMKERSFFVAFLLLLSCAPTKHDPNWESPEPGAIIAADSIANTEDALNHSYFSVRVSAPAGKNPANQAVVVYNIHARYGAAEADGVIAMPRGGEHLKPLLRKDGSHSFIVGFIPGKAYGGDTSFHDYYRIDGDQQGITIVPVKGFVID